MIAKEITISPEFKSNTQKAILSIFLFIITYIILFILAIGLTVLCVAAGLALIYFAPRLITIALGLGLASMGFLILIFLVKFLFKSHKVDRSHLTEIKKEDEPELFAMIQEIVDQVGTHFPKHVYLSADVNASVFYDSSFWSMFFPIRKNLQIGLGLVNTVTKDELKAILAHEFGHFSQETMKVGSYVYNVNQVIFNMLYDNDGYERIISRWASVSGYFAIFVGLAVRIVMGIQWVLQKVYDIVNKSYMALSREMEFHADEIAAHVTGFEPLKTSLLRLSMADQSFNDVLQFYEGKIGDNTKSQNLYKEQSFVLNFLAKDKELAIENDLPVVQVNELNKFNKSKLVIKDQWASHPSTEDRVERLEQTKLSAAQRDHQAANTIFKNIEQTQQRITNKLFQAVQYKGQAKALSLDYFKIEYQEQFEHNSFSKVYNSYYDLKGPVLFDLDQPIALAEKQNLEKLFSVEKVDLVYSMIALQNDIQVLEQIADKTLKIKTFDYDGIKYKRRESKKLIARLRKELTKLETQIQANDGQVYAFFDKLEKVKGDKSLLKEYYESFFQFDKNFEQKMKLIQSLQSGLEFVQYTMPIEDIHQNFRNLKPLEEELRINIRGILENDLYQNDLTTGIRDNFEEYISKELIYFGNEIYLERNLQILFEAINHTIFLVSRGYFNYKKRILDYQVELL